MPGSPVTTPRFGVDRYAQSDPAQFSPQFNQAVDKLDGAAKLTELNAEVARAEAAESTEISARAAAISTEASTRAAAVSAEQTARIAGDGLLLVHIATMDSETSPPQLAGSVIGHFPVPVDAGNRWFLVGVATRCMWMDATSGNRSVYKVQTDTGHSDGALATTTGLGTITPVTGRYLKQLATNAGVSYEYALNNLDTVAVTLVTPGNSRGISVALLLRRLAP